MSNCKTSRLTSEFIRYVGDRIAPRGEGGGRLCIVTYHRILESVDPLLESEPDVATFRWQMELLADCFNVMPLHDAVMALENQAMPPRAVAITFDDGYRSTHDLALPILNELGLPATVFVTSGHVGDTNMWNDKIIEALRHLPSGTLDLSDIGLGVYTLGSIPERKHAINKLIAVSKYLPPQGRLDLTSRLDDLLGNMPMQGLMLTRDMVARLAQHGVEIGGHTITHPILTSLEDDCARREIASCKEHLEQMTGKPVRLFAYPNGRSGVDYDERHVQMVKDAGYVASFTTEPGATTRKDDRYQVPRGRPWDTTPFMYGLRLLRWLGGAAA